MEAVALRDEGYGFYAFGIRDKEEREQRQGDKVQGASEIFLLQLL